MGQSKSRVEQIRRMEKVVRELADRDPLALELWLRDGETTPSSSDENKIKFDSTK